MGGAPTNRCLENSQVSSVSTIAGVPILIAKAAGGRTTVISVSCQPDADVHLQLVEGRSTTNRLSAIRFVAQNLLWSWRGKPVYDDVYILAGETGVNVQVEVRTIGAS